MFYDCLIDEKAIYDDHSMLQGAEGNKLVCSHVLFVPSVLVYFFVFGVLGYWFRGSDFEGFGSWGSGFALVYYG